MTVTRVLLFTALLGHILCWRCDLLITYAPGGRFQFGYLNDNEKMSKLFEGMSLKRPLLSMLLGVLALMMSFCGYLSLYEWMKQFSMPYAVIIMASVILIFIPGVTHHVFCGAVEWFYIRLDRTEEARKVILEFFKKTSVTMYLCFLGTLIFSVAFLAAVITGQTSLPRWGCIFNILPAFLVLGPFRVPGSFNIANAFMFLGLLFLLI